MIEKVKLKSLFNSEKMIEVDAVVDTGATMLVLPQNLVDELGLRKIRKVTVKYANNQRQAKSVYAGLLIEIKGRVGNFSALAEETGTEPLIGQIVLEELDLIIEPRTQTLMPNPRSPEMPMVEILHEEQKMPVVKIGPKRQVTIPKEIFDQLHLQAGDFLEAMTQGGKIVMIPKELIAKAPVPFLTKEEQEILLQVKEKISKIQTDLIHSQGLNDKEIELAIKVSLIDPEQAWWWKEEWQKGERAAEKEIAQREVSSTFKNIDEFVEHLSQK